MGHVRPRPGDVAEDRLRLEGYTHFGNKDFIAVITRAGIKLGFTDCEGRRWTYARQAQENGQLVWAPQWSVDACMLLFQAGVRGTPASDVLRRLNTDRGLLDAILTVAMLGSPQNLRTFLEDSGYRDVSAILAPLAHRAEGDEDA